MSKNRAIAGGSISPMLSASHHNSVLDLLAKSGVNTSEGRYAERGGRSFTELRIVNDSEAEVKTGGVLGWDVVYYDVEEDAEVAFQDIVFKGVKPTKEEHYSRLAVVLQDCEVGETVACYMPGWIQATVDITDEGHTAALLSAADPAILESSGAGYPLIVLETGLGSKWCIVDLSRTPPSGAGRITIEITAAVYDPATKEKTLGKGMMEIYSVKMGDIDVHKGPATAICTRVEETSPVDKDVQYHFINGRFELGMEPCKVGTILEEAGP